MSPSPYSIQQPIRKNSKKASPRGKYDPFEYLVWKEIGDLKLSSKVILKGKEPLSKKNNNKIK